MQRSLTSNGAMSDSASASASSNGASTLAEPFYPIPPAGTAFVSTYSMDAAALVEPEKPVSVTQSLDEDLEDESTIYLGSPKVRVRVGRMCAERVAGGVLSCSSLVVSRVASHRSRQSSRISCSKCRLGVGCFSAAAAACSAALTESPTLIVRCHSPCLFRFASKLFTGSCLMGSEGSCPGSCASKHS